VANILDLPNNVKRFRLLVGTLAFFCTVACGSGGDSDDSSGIKKSQLQSNIEAGAVSQQIPARLMLAVGYLESRLSDTPSEALYVAPGSDEESERRGLPIAETAFGVAKQELGLGGANTYDLPTQARAYSQWLRANLSEAGVSLPLMPTTTEDKIRWIWEISQYHRVGTRVRNDVRSIFARELVDVLNKGFYWQDAETGQTVVLPAENPRIRKEDMPEAYQTLLELGTSIQTDIPNVEYLPLATAVGGDTENRPNHIEIIHCPLSLSACLELQTKVGDDAIKLEAHYVVPANHDVLSGPVQIARHKRTVKLTDHQGNHRVVDNAVVVMLVGSSGRFDEGFRVNANPKWLDKQQIVDLTSIVGSVCQLFVREGVSTFDDCLSLAVDRPRRERELLFQKPAGPSYRWGDIPDFDGRIFASYLQNPGTKLPGAAEFSKDQFFAAAGGPISLSLGFTDRARLVVFERLVRCPDRSLKWAKVFEEQVRDVTSSGLTTRVWDAGPNGNGTQFFRAKVYSRDNLIGWDISEVYLSNFENEEQDEMTLETCR
jgi:hypothetical protein